MNGVEILSEYTVASQWAFNYWLALIVFAIASILIICMVIYYRDTSILWLFLFAAFISVIVGATVGALAPLECHQEMRYKVTIDDSVSMNEFLDKYEILDQEGKIYTVKEKNNQ